MTVFLDILREYCEEKLENFLKFLTDLVLTRDIEIFTNVHKLHQLKPAQNNMKGIFP